MRLSGGYSLISKFSMPLSTNKQFEEDNDLNPAPDSLFYWIALPFMVVITIVLLFVALTR